MRDAQADRGERRRLGREVGKRGERLVARGFQEVDAQIDRRPLRQRPALVRGLVAEARLELRREPFRKIARDMGRRAGKVGGGEPLPLGVGQRRRRMALAREQRRNRLDVEAARLPQRAEDFGPRRRLAHDPGGRAFPPQRVIDEARDRGAVAGAGEAMRQAPVLHRVGRRPAPGVDVGEHFDCGGGAGGGDHGRRVGRGTGSAATDRNPFVRKRKNVTGSADRSRYRARRQPDYSHW